MKKLIALLLIMVMVIAANRLPSQARGSQD